MSDRKTVNTFIKGRFSCKVLHFNLKWFERKMFIKKASCTQFCLLQTSFGTLPKIMTSTLFANFLKKCQRTQFWNQLCTIVCPL